MWDVGCGMWDVGCGMWDVGCGMWDVIEPGAECSGGRGLCTGALARNGQCAAALPYSKAALHLGTQDALKFFHRGMIERCLGRPAEARGWFGRALALNPHFSVLWAPTARRLAA